MKQLSDRSRKLKTDFVRAQARLLNVVQELEDELDRIGKKPGMEALLEKKDNQAQTIVDFINHSEAIIDELYQEIAMISGLAKGYAAINAIQEQMLANPPKVTKQDWIEAGIIPPTKDDFTDKTNTTSPA
ncbi:hypothetical protein [Xanthocytophaga agilis]|uniref:Uncharacterized protein n=1 Tax=Xanthocytophaga agilis TaxID=3048010 RepID=A0AAE3UDM1_9BACT|nr:hypothetical protein [Xanthocytophaga agilis]MDJ1500491.1 hypothetical protein [Xanthocytophaga agilis]